MEKRSRAKQETISQAKPRSTSSAAIVISNRSEWTTGQSEVTAEVVCTADRHFIAVFDSNVTAGTAKLGVVCGPLTMLPVRVRSVVRARTVAADAKIAGRKKAYAAKMMATDFQGARYPADDRAGERNVSVAVSGPLRGRTLSASMVAVILARVSFASRSKTPGGETHNFLLNDTVQTAGEDFTPPTGCFDDKCVFAFQKDGTLTERVCHRSAVEWVRLRLRDGANWLKQSSQCRTVRGVPSLISALQQAGEAPAQCGPLALRFFLAMRTDAFRSWRTASQPSFELCAEQHAVERRPNDPHTRCCCGLVNVNDDCPFTPRGGDDACRLYNRRWCCVSCGVLKTVTSNNKTLHT